MNFAKIFLAVSLSTVLVSCGQSPTGGDASAPSYKVGQVIKFDNYEVTIDSVETLNHVGYDCEGCGEKPADGAIFVAATYSLKNTGAKPLGMFERPSFNLIDPNGVSYEEDLGAGISYKMAKEFDGKSISDLNPGIKTKDGLLYEVAEANFDKQTWSISVDGDKVVYVALE